MKMPWQRERGKKRKKKNIAHWNRENPLAYLQTNKGERGGDDDNFNADEAIVKNIFVKALENKSSL